ncbi:hypothetical protein KEJ27_01265 [Candidatus Bathyarchaeota archaeon]|nr:hypothetical protein [Candidatus Bathyarchaeota archaeon]MBS7613026.1 hypothetical protein [Candidatus Bathyarchaeota archaeon]MBS7618183.1 hypothetical protein [Candidatus Bathyarchaeota archaeon]
MRIKIPKSFLIMVLIGVSLYLSCGGLYVLIEGREESIINQPWVVVQWGQSQRISITIPGLRSQTLGEGYIVGITLTISVLGLSMPYLCSKFKVSVKTMRSIIIASTILLLVSVYLIFSIYFSKYWGAPWP